VINPKKSTANQNHKEIHSFACLSLVSPETYKDLKWGKDNIDFGRSSYNCMVYL
jgi:hypothetical protein